jgi:GH15 family glucan-1,4-alpha-glucosidase
VHPAGVLDSIHGMTSAPGNGVTHVKNPESEVHPRQIGDYALIGDTSTAALVGREGSIDWFCAPRFDSAACFARLLGNTSNGRWLICPQGRPAGISRSYRGDTLILETEFQTTQGRVRLVDFMLPEARTPRIIRVVEGLSGRVPMELELIVRFDYGRRIPWVRRTGRGLEFVAGPDTLRLRSAIDLQARAFTHSGAFEVSRGEKVPFVLTWSPSFEHAPGFTDPLPALEKTERWWSDWSGKCTYSGPWHEAVVRSLIVLKALIYRQSGGIVAAPTTSLPESIGGARNWDYRYCWLRDATFSFYALVLNGYTAEARAWRDWLLRAIAGQTEKMQIMYGPAGEARLTEYELPWLEGFASSRPVRVGNAAAEQHQLDVYGEIMDAMFLAGRVGVPKNPTAWGLQRHLMESLAGSWNEPDEGIWEVRGPRRQFTHSKVMAWVAVDRAIRSVERFGLPGPTDKWKRLRAEIHHDVLENGYSARRRAFTWYYGSSELDASLLMIPLVGFLPPSDPRVMSTLAVIERELVADGFVRRYRADKASSVDGLQGGEGAFLPCTFWYADNLMLQGRRREARTLFARLLSLRNDVGLLSEEYDPKRRIMLGNFPQAFTHVSLINTALNLAKTEGPAHHRRSGD